jgi:hypothetical protein
MTPLLGFGGLTYNLLTDKGKPKQDTDPDGVFTVHVHQDDNPHLSDAAKKRSRKGKSAEAITPPESRATSSTSPGSSIPSGMRHVTLSLP